MTIHQGPEKVKIKDIAERQNISQKYLEQIVTLLSKNGIVHGERGPHGGYVLSRPASEITVADVVNATEGGISPVPCLRNGKITCDKADTCTSIDMWIRIEAAISKIMTETSIQDLVDQANAKGIIHLETCSPDYHLRRPYGPLHPHRPHGRPHGEGPRQGSGGMLRQRSLCALRPDRGPVRHRDLRGDGGQMRRDRHGGPPLFLPLRDALSGGRRGSHPEGIRCAIRRGILPGLQGQGRASR